MDPIQQKMSSMTAGAAPSVIQKDLVIKGTILTDGALELNGIVDGDVCAKAVTIGETATFRGDVVAELVVIGGDAKGRITARQVHLLSMARYTGDIIHQRIAIDEGAEFEGAVHRKKDDAAWTDITKTFELPGVELTEDAKRAVDSLRSEFANTGVSFK